MRRFLLAAVLVAACGGGDDPLAGVENCTELQEAVAAHLPTIDGDADAIEAFAQEVGEIGGEMAGDALARGADTEALICTNAVLELEGASVRETFDEISSGLD